MANDKLQLSQFKFENNRLTASFIQGQEIELYFPTDASGKPGNVMVVSAKHRDNWVNTQSREIPLPAALPIDYK